MKLLIGGSPCTHWSIAQTKHRETEPAGLGWELFKNYLIAREKFKPDFFLYENNKSMSKAIRAQITKELGVEPIMINSALVSAQNRQRLYWVGKRNPDGAYSTLDVALPEDREILLRDILETTNKEKGYALKVEHINPAPSGKSRTVDAHMGRLERNLIPRMNDPNPAKQQYDCVVETIRVGTIENDANGGGGDGNRDGTVCSSSPPAMRVREATKRGYVDILPGDCVDLSMQSSKTRRGRSMSKKSNCLTTSCEYYEYCGTLDAPVYKVEDGHVVVGGKQYTIKLRDGCHIIRKLSVAECKRLQTVPDSYIFPVSDNQAYKMLGNGWTVEVIAHILGHVPGITTEPLEVLSMYDGMSCGHIALDELGANVTKYYATEIDKFAVQTTLANYPDTIQLGDAFDVRHDDWELPKEIKKESTQNAEQLKKTAAAKPAQKVRVRVKVRKRRVTHE